MGNLFEWVEEGRQDNAAGIIRLCHLMCGGGFAPPEGFVFASLGYALGVAGAPKRGHSPGE
ncbi:MAG TPA: hypothetical protein VIT88_08805 [Pyrinomonadaceae bacterium]